MCLGIPGRVVSLKGQKARVWQQKHSYWVDISALEEKVRPGDYLLFYQNTAINKVTPGQAKEIFSLLGEEKK